MVQRTRLAGAFAMLLVMAMLTMPPRHAAAQGANVDRAASDALTAYLREHHLPLVGGSVSRIPGGGTQVMLYGYVATEKGKQNAAARAASYFKNDANVTVVNRIAVNPEIRNLGSSPAANTAETAAPDSGIYAIPAGGSAMGPVTFEQIYREIQAGGIHPAPDPADTSSAPW
jgi:hypothetical protein